jgi:hypothetical protein
MMSKATGELSDERIGEYTEMDGVEDGTADVLDGGGSG